MEGEEVEGADELTTNYLLPDMTAEEVRLLNMRGGEVVV
jgi:hypothetical protein